jgi:hypothetical protein
VCAGVALPDTGSTPAGVASAPAPGGASPSIPTTAASEVVPVEMWSFYVVLVGGALAGIVSSFFLRRFGVKLAWTG